MKKSDFLNHTKTAMEWVEEIDEFYRPYAFQIALFLLSTEDTQSISKQKMKPSVMQETGYLNSILNSDYDWTATNIPKLSPHLQNLEILRITKEEFGVKKLTANDIQAILSQKFRIPKTPNAISMSLMKEIGKHVSRTKDKKKFFYEITTNGIAFLDSEILKKGDQDQL